MPRRMFPSSPLSLRAECLETTPMPLLQLVRLRRDAVDRGVLPESVRPRVTRESSRSLVSSEHSPRTQHVSSIPSCNAAQGDVFRFQEAATAAAAKGDESVHPSLHRRPRYIYGDLYAPVYQTPTEFEARENAEQPPKQRVSMRNSGRRCKNCTENAGRPCIRLIPSSTGVSSAREVLIGRAFNGWPARRLRRTTYEHKPSPLRGSFTSELPYPKLELTGPGDTNNPTPQSSTSSDTLVDMEERLMSMVEGAGFSKIGDNALLSPDFMRRNVSCIFDNVQKPLLLSTVCSSLGIGAASEGDSEPSFCLDDLPEIEDEGEQFGDSQPVRQRRRVSFAELPSIQRGRVDEPRAIKHGSLLDRVAKAGLKRIRSLKSESFGKKLRRIN